MDFQAEFDLDFGVHPEVPAPTIIIAQKKGVLAQARDIIEPTAK